MERETWIVMVFQQEPLLNPPAIRQLQSHAHEWGYFAISKETAQTKAEELAKKYPQYRVEIGRFSERFETISVEHRYI